METSMPNYDEKETLNYIYKLKNGTMIGCVEPKRDAKGRMSDKNQRILTESQYNSAKERLLPIDLNPIAKELNMTERFGTQEIIGLLSS